MHLEVIFVIVVINERYTLFWFLPYVTHRCILNRDMYDGLPDFFPLSCELHNSTGPLGPL